MKSNKLLLSVLILALMTSCSGGGSNSSSGTTTPTPTVTLLSIAVTPANTTITVGSTIQLTATGTFSDNTTQEITASVTWSSSVAFVATISSGKATSVATGQTTITATSGSVSDSTLLTVNSVVSGSNVLTLTVNGSNCSAGSYQNKPCVSVTVCSPGTSNCQIVNDILLDTGSSGLRIFKSLLTTVTLNPVISGSGKLAECIQYLDGSSDWGPVQTADVILGNEPAVQVPIQVIDSTFGKVPSSCGIPDTSPTNFNGILGVSLFAEDCGSTCTTNANVGMYYVCSGTTCTSTKAPLSNQVQNPVALLPVDNNGVILELPSISSGGTPSVTGSLVLGIGTQSNNSPSGVTKYTASSIGEFTTVFNGTTYNQSFIDSGSNALYFPAPSTVLAECTGLYTGWFCPSSTTSLSATTKGSTGSPSNTVSFEIGNAMSLFNSGNRVFSELGGSVTGSPSSLYFDWGLPFFLGRSVYVGIEGKTSSLGTGPYWAY